MGSWLSGRRPEKVTVESCLTLNLALMLRRGSIKPGAFTAGSWTWTSTRTGETRGTISYEANLCDLNAAWVRLHYSVGDKPQDYRVWLRRVPCRFGGYRWWWQCPRTGRDSAKLYLPPGGTMFLSRRAYRMAYISERGGPVDRSHRRQARLYAKLGKQYVLFDQCPPRRPKGMHRRTYERLQAETMQAIYRHDVIFMAGAMRFIASDPKMRAEFLKYGTV
jgi:hypothetical protein